MSICSFSFHHSLLFQLAVAYIVRFLLPADMIKYLHKLYFIYDKMRLGLVLIGDLTRVM